MQTAAQEKVANPSSLLRQAFRTLPSPLRHTIHRVVAPLRSNAAIVRQLQDTVLEREATIRAREAVAMEREERIAESENYLRECELAPNEPQRLVPAPFAPGVSCSAPSLDDMPIYLGDRRLLARMKWGGRLIMPSYNLDVALMCLRDRTWEEPTTRLVQECLRQGQVAINVGANFGYFAVLGARLVGHTGRVIAIEANPYIIPFLVENTYLNGVYHTISIFHRAAWSRSGEDLNLCFAPAYLGGGSARELWEVDPSARPVAASLGDALWDHRLVVTSTDAAGQVHSNVPVVWYKAPTGTIDEICADVPQAHLIHMDIEGGEAHAMHGARKLVERSPDIRIIFEWDSHRWKYGNAQARAMWEKTWGWLVEQGFRVREVNGQAPDGALYMSRPLTFDYLSNEAAGSNFIAVRPNVDPWTT